MCPFVPKYCAELIAPLIVARRRALIRGVFERVYRRLVSSK